MTAWVLAQEKRPTPHASEVSGPSRQVQRCGERLCPPGACDHEGVQFPFGHRGVGPSAAASASLVRQGLQSSSRPLDAAIRARTESYLGHDFSHVRVHSDQRAASSARGLGALAYTVGPDIVFGEHSYSPETDTGKWLLTHELTHVIQQRGQGGASQPQFSVSKPGDAGENEAEAVADAVMGGRQVQHIGKTPPSVQRACGPDKLGSPEPDCTPNELGLTGWAFKFKVNCDELLPGEEAKFAKLKANSRLQIHGFASEEGLPAFNWDLSCHRANRIAELAGRLRPDCPIDGTFKHGPSPVSGPGVARDVNPPSFWRTAIIHESPPPARPQPQLEIAQQALTVVVIGSPSPDQHYQLQFATAAECLGSNSRAVWIVEKTGYELYGIDLEYFTSFAPPGGLIWVTPGHSLPDILNTFPDASIGRLVVYSHGVPGLVALRYGWGSFGKPDYGLSIPETARLGRYQVHCRR